MPWDDSLALNIHAKQTAIQAICQTMNGRYSNRWCRRHGLAVVLERRICEKW